jgi:hypothetical protein
VFGKTTTSLMTRGTLAKKSLGVSIAFQKQGLSLKGFGKNGLPRISQAKHPTEVVEQQQSTVTTMYYQWNQATLLERLRPEAAGAGQVPPARIAAAEAAAAAAAPSPPCRTSRRTVVL